jgi:hypothetical protein
VSAHLLAFIQVTMRPEHVSLWLRPSARGMPRGMPRDADRATHQDGAARATSLESSQRARQRSTRRMAAPSWRASPAQAHMWSRRPPLSSGSVVIAQ